MPAHPNLHSGGSSGRVQQADQKLADMMQPERSYSSFSSAVK